MFVRSVLSSGVCPAKTDFTFHKKQLFIKPFSLSVCYQPAGRVPINSSLRRTSAMAERGDKLFKLFVRRHSACGMSGEQINPLSITLPETVPLVGYVVGNDCLPRFCKKLLPLLKEEICFMSYFASRLLSAVQLRSKEPSVLFMAVYLLF